MGLCIGLSIRQTSLRRLHECVKLPLFLARWGYHPLNGSSQFVRSRLKTLGLCHDDSVQADQIRRLARDCGFELAGIARALPLPEDAARYLDWVQQGMAGAMGYLTDYRADIRADPRLLLPTARSIISVGKLYNGPEPR